MFQCVVPSQGQRSKKTILEEGRGKNDDDDDPGNGAGRERERKGNHHTCESSNFMFFQLFP